MTKITTLNLYGFPYLSYDGFAICLVSPIVGGWAQSSNVRATLVGTSVLRALTYALAVPALWVVFRSGWWGLEQQALTLSFGCSLYRGVRVGSRFYFAFSPDLTVAALHVSGSLTRATCF